MRALFLKDFRQGRPLLVTAFLLALLAPATFQVLVSPRFLFLAAAGDVALGFGVALAVIPSVLAFLAAAGLFSTEAENDTLPVLFALPLDRARIWAAKVLAGFALTAVASAILLGLDMFLMPKEFQQLRPLFWSYSPDITLWAFFFFSVGAFSTTIMPNIIASIALTIVLGGGLIVGVLALMFGLGAPLLGYPPELDAALWAFFTAPALLAASALVVTKGQLLQSRRKHLIAFPTLLLGLVVTIAVVCGLARVATRYQRSEVGSVGLEGGGVGGRRVVEVTARTAPKGFALSRFHRLVEMASAEQWTSFPYDSLSGHSIVLDLRTGKELLVARQPSGYGDSITLRTACSPDGRLFASIGRPIGLTYGELPWRPPLLRIWDVQKRTVTYQREFKEWKDRTGSSLSLSWSPTREYLLIGAADSSERYTVWADGEGVLEGELGMPELYTVRADGSGWQSISVGYETLPGGRKRLLRAESCQWAPHEDALIARSLKGVLYWIYPDGRTPKTIYTSEWTEDTYRGEVNGVSADGQWVALSENRSVQRGGIAVGENRIVVIRADGTGSQAIWSGSDHDKERVTVRSLAWSSQGQWLYALLSRHTSAEEIVDWRRRRVTSVYAWKPGQDRLQRIGSTIPYYITQLRAVPGGDEVLVRAFDPTRFPQPYGYDEFAPIAESGQALLVDPQGRTREVKFDGGSERLVKEYLPQGLDDQGHLIIEPRRQDCLKALDLNTGKVERIYP